MKTINVDIYQTKIEVYFHNEKELFEKRAKYKVNDSYGCVVGSQVWFKEIKPDINTIVHEAFHLSYEILNYRGVKDEEARAYLLGFIVDKLMGKLHI